MSPTVTRAEDPAWDPSFIRDGTVNTALYWSEPIFRQEIQLIWRSTWVYLAHESEIDSEGDYVTRTLAGEPIVVSRGRDGQVCAVVNRCAHRGNLVCIAERGNARSFRCPYHGWTYKADGTLVGVPYRSGYDDDWFEQGHDLARVPRLATYRGFVFASWNADVEPLEDYLAGAKERIDRFVDLAPAGRIRLSAGTHKISIRANWKMWVENSVDNYHQNFVHQAPLFLNPALKETSVRVSADGSQALVRSLGRGHAELDFAPEQRAMGKVHRTSAAAADPESEAAYRGALVQRLGEERTNELLADGPPHVMIFPNLFLLQQDIRVIEPVGPMASRMQQFPVLLEGAPDAVNLARVRRHEQAYGPAGSVLPDDIEIFQRNQRAMDEGTFDQIQLRRGIHRERTDKHGQPISHITDEVGQRAIWRFYAQLMNRAAEAKSDDARQHPPAEGSGQA